MLVTWRVAFAGEPGPEAVCVEEVWLKVELTCKCKVSLFCYLFTWWGGVSRGRGP